MRDLKLISISSLLVASFLGAAQQDATATEPGAPEMDLHYEIYVGGFHALDGSMALSLEGESYSSALSARSRGLFDFFADFRLETRAAGMSGESGPKPLRFDSVSDSGDKSRRVVVHYGDDGEVSAEVDPPSEKDEKYPIPQHMRQDTLDPLSTVLALGWTQLGEGGCEEDLEVFDGRRRFDLEVENLGWRTLERSSYLAFEGDALACSLKLRMLAYGPQGERKDSYPDEAVIYLARLAEGWPLVPIRLEMKLSIGSVRGHLASYDLPAGTVERSQADR